MSTIADQLRQLADELDAQAADPAAAAELAAARADQAAVDATAPAGISQAGWEGFLRGDNPASLSPADVAALTAGGFLGAPAAPSVPAPVDPTVTTDPGTPAAPAAPDASQTGGTDATADQPPSSATSVSGTSLPADEGAPAESVPADPGQG